MWVWIVGGLALWLVLATAGGIVLGRAMRLADQRSQRASVLTTADLPGAMVPGAAAARAGVPAARRRAIPLPPVGIGLAALAVTLMTAGYVVRLTDATGPLARALDMDAPFAAPRMFVAALFAVAAVAAVIGAARTPARRTFWLVVSLVAALIATVKAGGTVHHEGMNALRDGLGDAGAIAVSGLLAAAVVAGLWTLTRTERRDRRRVLGTLALYAGASVGLSAISTVVPSGWAATATYLEESGEALAAVAFLIGVLVGVAPRLVLPAAWALRRAADVETVTVSDVLPGRSASR
jgi:disulfide bond formation protein DsbB